MISAERDSRQVETTPVGVVWAPGDGTTATYPSARRAGVTQTRESRSSHECPRVTRTKRSKIVLHGAVLATRPNPQVAVIVEPTRPARIATLLMPAYGMTDRETEVTQRSSVSQVITGVCHAGCRRSGAC